MNARPQDHFHTSHISQNFHYTCTFWSCVSKNSEAFCIIFKFGWNFDAQILKIGKIHRKLKINKRQYCFANISATKAPILMKLRTSIHKIVKNHPQIFRKDPCPHACTRGINVRTRVSSRQIARAHVYASCGRMYARIFTKNHLMILYYLMNKSLKFHKDRSFRCGDIRKTILMFV